MVKAIVDMAIFLEYTNSELLDEDAAIGALEQLAAELQLMSHDDQQALSRQIIALAEDYEPKQRQFVAELPGMLGLG